MSKKSRRIFIKAMGSGIAGSMVLPAHAFSKPKNPFPNDFGLSQENDNSEAFWETVKAQFKFTPGLKYFNNASLGASPIAVQKATTNFRKTLDSFPSKYGWGAWDEEKENTRKAVADLFSVSHEEIALIHNTTEGMNLIARSFNLKPGDEVILADHEHASAFIPWEAWQETKGIKLVRPILPINATEEDDIVAVYKKAITSRTKVIMICHLINTTGMILPVKAVSEMAHQKGILVGVDAAQSAGMFNINLRDLGCDFYAASGHKWLFSPKGIGIFYAKKESQAHLKPLMVARGHQDESIRRLENYNSRNLPEVLGLGASIAFHNNIGSEKIHKRSYALKDYFRSKFEGNPKFKLKTPASNSLSAAIQVVEVVGKNVRAIKKELFEHYGIDCRPMDVFKLNALRFSFAIYITKKDVDILVDALEQLSGE